MPDVMVTGSMLSLRVSVRPAMVRARELLHPTREASAWNHGYVVRALSTNADRRTVVEGPTLSQDELLALATSERWCGR